MSAERRLRHPPLVAVAHGSKDPRATATIATLLSRVRFRAAVRGLPGLDVRAAFLDHCAPSLPDVLAELASTADAGIGAIANSPVLVPLLLTAAYHSKSDIPAQVAAAGATLPQLHVRRATVLGPHPLLLAALERRLGRRHAREETTVVLAAAGSSDPEANATIGDLATGWQATGGWRRVIPAYASAAAPSPGEAVRAARRAHDGPVVVASYLLSPGYFADKVRARSLEAGAVEVSAALGALPEVAEVILDRYTAAAELAHLPAGQWSGPSKRPA